MYRNVSYKIDKENGWMGIIREDTWDEQGNPITIEVPHRSYLYYEAPNGHHKSMMGTKLERMEFTNIIQKYKWVKENRHSKKIYEHFHAVKEYLLNKYEHQQESQDFTKFKLRKQFLDIEVETDGSGFPHPEQCNQRINVICIYDDIDRIYYSWVLPNKKYHDIKALNFVDTDDQKYFMFMNEHEMLCNFVEWFHDKYPDILLTFNGDQFDIPYLCNRINKICGNETLNKLSPVNEVTTKFMKDKKTKKVFQTYNISGVTHIDWKFLYDSKFQVEKLSDYKLDTIAHHELKVGKMEYEGTITQFHRSDFMKFVEYCRIDVMRLWQLEVKKKLIDVTRMLCNYGLVEYNSIYNSSPYIVGAIALQCRSKGVYILTSTPKDGDIIGEDDEKFEGAFVWPTKKAMYRRGIASFDVNSLYPNIIRTLNISPETKIGKIEDQTDPDNVVFKMRDGRVKMFTKQEMDSLRKQTIQSGNNVFYYKYNVKEGIIPSFVSRLYYKRVEFKDKAKVEETKLRKLKAKIAELDAFGITFVDTEINTKCDINKILEIPVDKLKNVDINPSSKIYNTLVALSIITQELYEFYDNTQMAVKIFLNSIYGQLGSSYFPLYDLDNAEAVTKSGQKIIQFAGKYVADTFNMQYEDKTQVVDIDDVVVAGDTDSCFFQTKIKNRKIKKVIINNKSYNINDIIVVKRYENIISINAIDIQPTDHII